MSLHNGTRFPVHKLVKLVAAPITGEPIRGAPVVEFNKALDVADELASPALPMQVFQLENWEKLYVLPAHVKAFPPPVAYKL